MRLDVVAPLPFTIVFFLPTTKRLNFTTNIYFVSEQVSQKHRNWDVQCVEHDELSLGERIKAVINANVVVSFSTEDLYFSTFFADDTVLVEICTLLLAERYLRIQHPDWIQPMQFCETMQVISARHIEVYPDILLEVLEDIEAKI